MFGTGYKDYPERITDPDNKLKGQRVSKTVSPQFATFGSIFLSNPKDQSYHEKIAYVKIPSHEPNTVYLLSIGLTMIDPYGGDFDEDDKVFADIYSIGVDPDTDLDIKPNISGGYGGNYSVFGPGPNAIGISTYIGVIKGDSVKFRLGCLGDDIVGASYFVLELGIELKP
jgi:hypothetical protein